MNEERQDLMGLFMANFLAVMGLLLLTPPMEMQPLDILRGVAVIAATMVCVGTSFIFVIWIKPYLVKVEADDQWGMK